LTPSPHQVAVALLHNVAEMNADTEFDALVGRDLGVAVDHRPLNFDGAVHRIDGAAELDDATVAGALSPMMSRAVRRFLSERRLRAGRHRGKQTGDDGVRWTHGWPSSKATPRHGGADLKRAIS
jgi:hypothetical protein